jgi:hypothetical protein
VTVFGALNACLTIAERAQSALPAERALWIREIIDVAREGLRGTQAPTFVFRVTGHQREVNGRIAVLSHPDGKDCAHVGVAATDGGGFVAFGPIPSNPGPDDIVHLGLSFVDAAVKFLPDVGHEVRITVELGP